MKLRKVFFIQFVIFILALLILSPGFSQVKKEGTLSFTGSIDNIPKDSKFIVVNERRVFISSDTKIATEKGSILRMNDLKVRLHVAIEGVEKKGGIYAEKITVIRTPKIKP